MCSQYPGKKPEQLVDYHYNSWVKQYNLICENSEYRSLYKQVIQFVSAIAQLITLFMADAYGRKSVFTIVSI